MVIEEKRKTIRVRSYRDWPHIQIVRNRCPKFSLVPSGCPPGFHPIYFALDYGADGCDSTHGCDEVKQVAGYTLPVALHNTQHRIVCHTKGRNARVRAKSDEGVRNLPVVVGDRIIVDRGREFQVLQAKRGHTNNKQTRIGLPRHEIFTRLTSKKLGLRFGEWRKNGKGDATNCAPGTLGRPVAHGTDEIRSKSCN